MGLFAADSDGFGNHFGGGGREEQAEKLRVVVDAGHGGPDGGVVGITSGVKESEINLEIAFLLGEFLSSAGVEVVYTRTTDGLVYDDVDAATMKQKDMAARKRLSTKATRRSW